MPEITISLVDLAVTADGFEARFDLDPATRHRLLEGLDADSLSLGSRRGRGKV